MKLSKTQLKHFIGGNGACDWNCDPYKERTNNLNHVFFIHSMMELLKLRVTKNPDG